MHPRDGVVVVANVHNGYTKYVADKVGWPVNWGPTLETCCSKDPAQARRTSSPGRPSGERNFPDLIFRRQEDQHSPPLRWKMTSKGEQRSPSRGLHMIRSTTHSKRKWISNDSHWRGALASGNKFSPWRGTACGYLPTSGENLKQQSFRKGPA
jgi:hypothetical protein